MPLQRVFPYQFAEDALTGDSQVQGVLYVGNTSGDNGTDAITGILISGTSMQVLRDQIGMSLTSIWAPSSATPPNPYHFGYDSLIYTGLSGLNTVASLTLTAMGAFSANWGLTASSGKTVTVTDGVGYAANPPTFVGVGTMSYTRNSGVWVNNQGNARIGTSYGLRVDAQSGSTTTNYALYTAGSGINHLGDVLQTSGQQKTIVYKNTSYGLSVNDEIVLADCGTGSFTFTLPAAAASNTGAVFTIKRIDSSGNTCTVSSNGSFIDASSSYSLTAQYKYVTVASNGTQYFIIANN